MCDGVHEYMPRPGHWIRYWDDASLRLVFGQGFAILALEHVLEDESHDRPVPCHVTILVARKQAGGASDANNQE